MKRAEVNRLIFIIFRQKTPTSRNGKGIANE
jgi:hypothetical protein